MDKCSAGQKPYTFPHEQLQRHLLEGWLDFCRPLVTFGINIFRVNNLVRVFHLRVNVFKAIRFLPKALNLVDFDVASL